jgi:hypothetical protein
MSAEAKEVTYTIDNISDGDEDKKHTWKSCCLKSDKTMIVFLSQILTTLLILAFCAFQLAKSEFDCNKSSPYIGLISFILGKLLATISTSH